MVDVLVGPGATLEAINALRDAFLEEMAQIPELDQALPRIPESVSSTSLVMRFIDEEESERQAMGLSRVRWLFDVELYCYGFFAPEMQERFESIVLQMRQRLRANYLLNRTLKKRFEISRIGGLSPATLLGDQVVFQRWRYVTEVETKP